MSHANAALTPRHRLKVAQLVVDHGWPISEVAARFQVAWPTVKRWADRYRAGESMEDRSSRPKSSPNKTSATIVKRCVSLRLRLREGPVQLACRLGIAPSTVHHILVDVHLNRLTHVDRATGEPIRRYEHDHPGAMLHVDVKKLGNIPDGGGWRYVGRQQGEKNRAATPDKPRNKHHDPLMGKAYVHTPSSTTTPASPTPRSMTTKPPSPPPPSWSGPSSGSAPAASPSSECCPTTAAPTAHTCGETPAPSSASNTNEHGRIGRRPTGRSNASTAPWPMDGPTPAATHPRPNAAASWTAGCTTTTTTVPTLPAATSRPSRD